MINYTCADDFSFFQNQQWASLHWNLLLSALDTTGDKVWETSPQWGIVILSKSVLVTDLSGKNSHPRIGEKLRLLTLAPLPEECVLGSLPADIDSQVEVALLYIEQCNLGSATYVFLKDGMTVPELKEAATAILQEGGDI